MARLIYSTIASLDGYVADEDGNFDWAAPDEEAHAFVNELERPVGTYLYGRRMYETMVFWETVDTGPEPQVMRDFAEIWRAAEKVVYSRTLDGVSSERTKLEREFDPDSVRQLVASADRDVGIGGAELAARAFEADLIDELQMFLAPVVVGGGKRSLPEGVFARLELLDQQRFESGFTYLRYEETLETAGVAGGEAGRLDLRPVPARPVDAGRVVASVEAQAGDDHEDVLVVGVDGDPAAEAARAPVGELAGDHRLIE